MTGVTLHAVVDALRDAELLVDIRGALPARVDAVTDDSRAVRANVLFVAVRGA